MSRMGSCCAFTRWWCSRHCGARGLPPSERLALLAGLQHGRGIRGARGAAPLLLLLCIHLVAVQPAMRRQGLATDWGQRAHAAGPTAKGRGKLMLSLLA